MRADQWGSAASVRAARLTLLLCTAAALLEGFDNQSMGVAVPRVALEFGLSDGQKGLILSAATFGLFLGAAVGGRAADILGRKPVLIASMLLFGSCSFLTAIAHGVGALSAARLLTGLGLGGAMPNYIALSSESARPERRVSSVTIVMAAMPLGGAISGLIALGDRLGWGWRPIFYIGGIAPVLLALLLLRALPNTGLLTNTRAQVASVPMALFGEARAVTTSLLWIGFFCTQLVLLLMLNWLPSLLVGLGLSRTEASWASVCFNLSGAVGAAVLGRLHAGTRRRAWVLLTYAGMALALLMVPSVGRTYFLELIACALAGVFIIGAQLTLFALAPLYYRRTIRGTGVGAAVAIGRLGSVVGPLYATALLVSGGSSATVLIGIVPFVIVAGSAALALTWRLPSTD
jgi:AAHS family 3-hydroxyphenylpropionic acid transporter